MSDLQQAKALLESDATLTCVLCREGKVQTRSEKGILPLVLLLREGDARCCAAADRIIGRAAALLFVKLGVKAVHGQVMTAAARDILLAHGISTTLDVMPEWIVNRKGDGPCPMERAVEGINDPDEALAAVEATLESLR